MSKGLSPVILMGAILGMISATLSLSIFPQIAGSLAGTQESGTARGQAQKLADEINQVCEYPMKENPVQIDISEDYELEVDDDNKRVEVEVSDSVATYSLSECEDFDIVERHLGSGSYLIVQENGEIEVQ